MSNKRKFSILTSIFIILSIMMHLSISAGEITPDEDKAAVVNQVNENDANAEAEPGDAEEENEDEIRSITLEKTVSNEKPAPGDKITYSYKVTNTGNVTLELKDITIDDSILNETLKINAVESGELEPGKNYTFTTTEYTVKSEDAGKKFTSAAKASVTIDGVEEPIQSDEASAEFTVKTLSLSVKIAVDKEKAVVGDTLNYTIEVKNDGETDLKDIIVKADLGNDTLTPSEKFDLGINDEPKILTATYVVKEKDKKVTNVVSAIGKDPNENDVNSNSSSVETVVNDTTPTTPTTPEPTRSLKLVKTVNNEHPLPGETVTYKFEVTNTGNITLKNIKIEDPMIDKTKFNPQYVGSLEAGKSATFTATYTVPKDAKAGDKTTNIAKAIGECQNNVAIRSNESCATFTVAAEANKPSFCILKTVDNPKPQKGDTVTYTIKVTNTGNVALYNVKVEDEALGYTKTIDKLDVGKYAKVEITKTVKEDAGKVFTNTAKATVKGLDPVCSSVSYTVAEKTTIYLPSTGEKLFLFDIIK